MLCLHASDLVACHWYHSGLKDIQQKMAAMQHELAVAKSTNQELACKDGTISMLRGKLQSKEQQVMQLQEQLSSTKMELTSRQGQVCGIVSRQLVVAKARVHSLWHTCPVICLQQLAGS